MDTIARLKAIANGEADAEPYLERLTRLSGQTPLAHSAGAWVAESIAEIERNLNLASLRCALVIASDGVPAEIREHHLNVQELIGLALAAVERTRSALQDAPDWGL